MNTDAQATARSKLARRAGTKLAQNLSLADFVHALGSPLDALMYSAIFWPQFVDFEGMTFWAEALESDEERQAVRVVLERSGSLEQTERNFNFVPVSQLFGRRIGETSPEEDLLLMTILSEAWAARLLVLFPQKEFIVRVVEAEAGSTEVALLFYETRQ